MMTFEGGPFQERAMVWGLRAGYIAVVLLAAYILIVTS